MMKVLPADGHSRIYMVMEWVEGRLLRKILIDFGIAGKEGSADVRQTLPGDGHARLHFPRAGERQTRRRAQRHLRAGRHAL
jgi:hypothetical protein